MRSNRLRAALEASARRLVLLAAVLSVGGCLPRFSPLPDQAPPLRLSHPTARPVADGRAPFRQIVCTLADQRLSGKDSCERLIWRLTDEPPVPPTAPPPALDPKIHVLIVPGAFAECFPEYGMPFEDAAAALRQQGLPIDFIDVSGRSGADHNAAQIAAAVDRLAVDPVEKIVLIGHSKGAVDILHFLVNHPIQAGRVRAALSVSGPITGSPLADSVDGAYVTLFARMPFRYCPPGDRHVIDSLRRPDQSAWLASHRLPEHVRYFSLAGFVRRDDVHPLMLFTYDALAAAGARNDGYVAITDQLIPGATLLGYVNLDHWDIALPVRERLNFGGIGSRAEARQVLFEAMLLTVSEALRFSP